MSEWDETDDSFFDDEDDFEEGDGTPIDETDVRLAELNMLPKLKDVYVKKVDDKIWTAKGDFTVKFFQWYVDCCDLKQLEILKVGELSDRLQEIFQERMNELLSELPKKEEEKSEDSKLQGYIEKNAELAVKVNDLTEKLKESRANEGAITVLLKILYDVMTGGKMEFKDELTKEELNNVKKIEEVLGIE